jgi:hypothetical protein
MLVRQCISLDAVCDRETSLHLSMLSLSTMLTLTSLSCSSLLPLASLLHRLAIILAHRPRFLCSFAASLLAAHSRASLLSCRSPTRNPRNSLSIWLLHASTVASRHVCRRCYLQARLPEVCSMRLRFHKKHIIKFPVRQLVL